MAKNTPTDRIIFEIEGRHDLVEIFCALGKIGRIHEALIEPKNKNPNNNGEARLLAQTTIFEISGATKVQIEEALNHTFKKRKLKPKISFY